MDESKKSLPKMINPDPVSFTTHHLHLAFTTTDVVLSSATGFVYFHDSKFYFITNYHNVSGKNPVTGTYISNKAGVPDVLITYFRDKNNLGASYREFISLYQDTEMMKPAWFIHPIHKEKVDVVAIEIPDEICQKYELFPINKIRFDNDKFEEKVSDEVFVIGYPFSESPMAQMPIWKKGSIASEPVFDWDKLPKFLIDTATRPGLSGSPVIMQRTGVHGMKNQKFDHDTIIGTIRRFVGVYSGRIGEDELKAQLGIVWKAQVINEIIAGKQFGNV